MKYKAVKKTAVTGGGIDETKGTVKRGEIEGSVLAGRENEGMSFPLKCYYKRRVWSYETGVCREEISDTHKLCERFQPSMKILRYVWLWRHARGSRVWLFHRRTAVNLISAAAKVQ